MTRPNGSGQSMGNTKAEAPPGNLPCRRRRFRRQLYIAMGIDHWPNFLLPISPTHTVHLGGDLERQAAARRDLYRLIGTFLGCDATEKGRIAPGIRLDRQKVAASA